MNERECRRALTVRSGGSCERCGKNYPPSTLHHRRKKSSLPKNLMWELGNCVHLCGHGTTPNGCHSWVESNPVAAELEGWHIRPWNSWEDTPVTLHDGRTVLLGAEYVSSPKP